MTNLKPNRPVQKPNPVFIVQVIFLIVFIVALALLAFAEPGTNFPIGL